MNDLFENTSAIQPLAAALRPNSLDDYIGQQHILASGKPLREAIEQGQLHSMIFWGPPGVGKTTLAQIITQACDAHFIKLSAVLSGVKDIRDAVQQAQQKKSEGRRTVLFVDEVHRFNKSQQDAFLPFVEDGTLLFIGATTENPSFELNNALLSRARVYKLRSLLPEDLSSVVKRGIDYYQHNNQTVVISDDEIQRVAHAADGDARRCLNFLELAVELAHEEQGKLVISADLLSEVLSSTGRRFDKGGDVFYEQISALHKAVRGSSPDAALYWFARMLDGGCDPLYIARRVVRMASEDIGNADPRALTLALNAWDVQERLGSPEGELTIAQAIVYMASAAKSNAVYTAYKQAVATVNETGTLDVPLHLRNAPTQLMKAEGYAQDYRYAHDEEGAYVAGENYFPEALADRRFYFPVDRGLEKNIGEKLTYLRDLDTRSDWQRYKK